ncbi:cell division control protein 6 homolog [Dendropsophus ebraccatus]|uniref:cell division control protein 6 homolog n=1 Tax=Dendropsophus ebraccatus TaxID=150705 RepID=UPI003831AE8A
MPSTRSQSQSSIQFPKTKTAKTQAKGALRLRAKSEVIAPVPLSPAKELPLSPRKRLGDDNLCNIPQSLRCSPPKQSRNENTPFSPAKGRRLIFDENQAAATPLSPVKKREDAIVLSPQKRGQETPTSSSQRVPHERKSVGTRLFKQEASCYQQAKCALNTAVPERLLAREKETSTILSFLKGHVSSEKPGSLYISGAPGTGKTACLNKIMQENKEVLEDCKTVYINCMSLRSSQAIFPAIAEEISGNGKSSLTGKDVVRQLEKLVTSKGPMILLVLDEMDQLDSKGHDVLYTVFEWPWLANSRIVLIGIANALDLTDRILPRLQARPGCKPQLLNFSPYTKDQIATILQDRLTQVSGDPVLDNAAIQFCARKVSAVSGDARKALDICRRAVEIVESDVRSQTVLKPRSECASPAKEATAPVPKKVSLPHISRVISDVYGDKMSAGSGGEETFPLQQKLVVCSLLLLTQNSKIKEVTMGKLYDTYSKVCRKQQMAMVGQSECLSLCQLLETRGILGLKKAKEARLTKVCLKIEERDIEHAFKDKVLIGNVLHAGI